MHFLRYTLLLALCATLCAAPAEAKKKKTNAAAALLVKKDSTDAIKKAVKGAEKRAGLFTTYHNQKDGTLFFELPDSVFGRMYMLSSRIAQTSDGSDFVAGQMNVTPIAVELTRDSANVYLRKVQYMNTAKASDPITPALRNANLNPVMAGFKITARGKHTVLINVTRFFATNEKSISPLKNTSPVSKLLGASDGIKGTFVAEASGLLSVKTFEANIEIESQLSFQTTGAIQKPYSVVVHRSLFALPDEASMPRRYQDNRVGFFYTDKNIFSSDADRIEQRSFINRWRLQPKAEDRDRYFAGELVEPEHQIVFYVDSAFPEKWRSTIMEGIESWNTAFEAAGFKHAVKALPYPKNDTLFSPDNMRYNCFRYVATRTANAMGPSYTDPRTGEILAANVIWYHNIVSLLHNWRFIQTGAADPRVRKPKFDDEVMCEAIRYAAAHEIGHCLGLMHNMGASYSFPVEKLRDPAFTQKYGTTPSIMDYARNNYIAQPGDVERGVKLTPPDLGVYDIYAIRWGYRLIKDADTPDAELPTLRRWIAEKQADPMYEFGAQQFFSTIDPTDQTEDLGDDHIAAGDYGIKNLRTLMSHFEEWTAEPGERYDEMERTYGEVVNQYARYLRHVVPYVGGIVFKEIRQGDGNAASKTYVGKARQKQALTWLIAQLRSYDSWLTPPALIKKLELDLNTNNRLRSQIVNSLLNSTVLYRIRESYRLDTQTGYRLDDYLSDLTSLIFTAPKGGQLSTEEMELESAAVAQMLRTSGLQAKGSASALALDDFADEKPLGEPQSFCTCHLGEDSFARLNMGTSSLSKVEMGALMLGRLKAVSSKFRAYLPAAKGDTRDFYNYQILLIEKALAK